MTLSDWPPRLFPVPSAFGEVELLADVDIDFAKAIICEHHYTRSVPSGKSYYMRIRNALVV